ncbi:MAG TPA: hypothetical protein VJ476_12370 [Rhizomicrobium sp.]|nr:hypothetical protein [Rhizomicrobium sp.]
MIGVAAALLFIASLATWFVAAGARPSARVYLRFATVLFAALAVAAVAMPVTVRAIALLVLPLGAVILALATATALTRPLDVGLSAALLAAVSLCALGAAVTNIAALSLTPIVGAALAVGILSVKQRSGTPALQGLAASLCFLGAASTFAFEGVQVALLLFTAAGTLGLTLALSRSDAYVGERAARDLRGGTRPRA